MSKRGTNKLTRRVLTTKDDNGCEFAYEVFSTIIEYWDRDNAEWGKDIERVYKTMGIETQTLAELKRRVALLP